MPLHESNHRVSLLGWSGFFFASGEPYCVELKARNRYFGRLYAHATQMATMSWSAVLTQIS